MNSEPFNLLSEETRNLLDKEIIFERIAIGERLCRLDELPSFVYIILNGTVRLLVESQENNELITLEKRGSGQLIGWVSLLRGGPCETVQASTEVKALKIPSEVFVSICKSDEAFLDYFQRTTSIHENAVVKNLKSIYSTLK